MPAYENYIQEVVAVYINNCLKFYKAYILRHQVHQDYICITIMLEMLKKSEQLWQDIKKNMRDLKLPGIDFSNLNPEVTDLSKFCEILPTQSISFDSWKNLRIILHQEIAAKATIHWTLKNLPRSTETINTCYCIKPVTVDIGIAEMRYDSVNISLAQYRKYLTAKYIAKALGKSGHVVDQRQYNRLPSTDSYSNEIFIVCEKKASDAIKTSSNAEDPCLFRLNVGTVTLKNNCQEIRKHVTAEYLFNLRFREVEDLSSSRANSTDGGEKPSWVTSVSNLTTATINFELLTRDPRLNFEFIIKDNYPTSQDGALLIMYNYARLLSILRRFCASVKMGDYPPLPPEDKVDYSYITSKNDELQLLQSLLEWPRLLESTVDFIRKEINITLCLRFIKELTQKFNRFYTHSFVLAKSTAPHSFNKMMARIYLLKALRKVYEEFFELIQVEFESETI